MLIRIIKKDCLFGSFLLDLKYMKEGGKMFKKRKKDKNLLTGESLHKLETRPLHPSDITRGPFPLKSFEARKILKKFKI